MSPGARLRLVVLAAAAVAALAAAPAAQADVLVSHVGSTLTETTGNGDGLVAPGEGFALTERIANSDSLVPSMTGVTGTLAYDPGTTAQAGPPLVSLANVFSNYPNLAFGAQGDNQASYTGTLASAAECGVNLPFVLSVASDQGPSTVPFQVRTGLAGPSVAWDSVDVPHAIPDGAATQSSLAVSAAGRVKDVRVRIGSIPHTRTGDVKIELVSPSGASVVLVNAEGGNGQDFSNTTFSDSAAQTIVGAAAPFTGTYRPLEPLSKMIGRSQQGTWYLRVTDQAAGNTGQIAAWGVDVRTAVCNANPIASFTATPNPALPGQAIALDASGSVSPTGTIAKYEWDVNNTGTFVDRGTVPTHSATFPTRGSYPVTLRVTDGLGRQSTSVVNLSVTVPPTAAMTSSPASPLTAEDVTLDASGSTDPDGLPIAKYEWDLTGTGTFTRDTGTTPTTTVQFATPGTKTVRVRVTDVDGATAVASRDIVVANRPPVAALAVPTPAVVGVLATFDAGASTDPDGAIVRYEWDLDGSGTYATDTGNVSTLPHTFNASGTYPIGVRVTDDQGVVSTIVQQVVATRAPVPSFTASANPTSLHRPVSFDATASADPDGTIARHEWDLDGNGTFETDTGSSPLASHVYDQNGTYAVKLRVTDDKGAQAQHTVNLVAANLAPTPALSVNPGRVPAGQPVTLDAGGSSDPDGTIVKYEWDLDGNGTFEKSTGATSSLTRSYPNPGGFTVGVRITDNDGATRTTTQSLTVLDAPAGGPGSGPGGSDPGSGGSGDPGGFPSVATGPLRATLSGSPLQRIAAVTLRGLAVGCQADRVATCALVLELRAADARRLGLRTARTIVLGRATLSVRSAGIRTGRVRLTAYGRYVLRRAPKVLVVMRATVRASALSVRLSRTFLLRR
ncbi:MAG: large repetitive protein [Solirubrobacteraceae bacterium]|jgi:YD repeat-containing protein|nr:large repetitive protein [Solirubrobacteraceae bacterium]